MKKIVYAIAALALIFTGCAKELDNSTKDNFSTVRLHVKVADQLTKVSADNDGRYHWQGGDEITVFDDLGASFVFSTKNGGSDVDFGATSWSGEDLGKYAMYPASSHSVSGDVVGFNLPSSYKWKANSTNMPMLGKINEDVATFKAVGGVLKLVCYNVPADAVKMEFSATNKQISGSFNIANAADETPIIVTAAMAGSNNKVSFDFTGDRKDNMVFYIPLPTGTIDGFTVSFLSDVPEVVFTKTSIKSLSVSRNQMIIAPALNCSNEVVLWRETFAGYSANTKWTSSASIQTGTGYDAEAFGGASVTYLSDDGTSTYGTKVVEQNNAGGASPEINIGNNYGFFQASGIPTNGAETMLLTFKENANEVTVTSSTDNVTITGKSFASKTYTATVNNPDKAATIDLKFAVGTTYARFDDVRLIIEAESSTVPVITSGNVNLTIGIGQLSKSTSVGITNPVDNLGLSYVLSKKDDKPNDWISSIEISAGTLTVTAKDYNGEVEDREAILTLKATGAADRVINLKQTSALVQKPASITTIPGNASMSASWTKAEHATGYLAYLCESSGLADPTGGTALTPSIEGSTVSVSKPSGLSNGTIYYLYVKVNTVDTNYIADSEWTEESVTPENVIYYEKITAVGNLESDVKYLIVNESAAKALDGSVATAANYNVANKNLASVTIGADKIVANSTTNAMSVTISGDTGEYTILTASGFYLGQSSGTGMTASTDTPREHSITFSEGNAVIKDNENDMQLRYNSTWTGFRYYAGASVNPVQLYKYNDPRTPADIEWQKSGVKATTDGATMLTGADTMPSIVLDNPHGLSVSFTSSDPTVATVISSSSASSVSAGAIATLLKAGTATITASFADGDATYRPATVKYTVTVTDDRTTPVITLDTTDENRTDSDYSGFTGRSATVSPSVALVYSKTDASSIIDEFNTSTGALTLSGNTGSATVTVSFAGNTEYKSAVSQSYTIKVSSSSGPVILDAPASPTITKITPTSLVATWTAAENAQGYSWKITTSSDPSSIAITNGSGLIDSGATTTVSVTSGITLSSEQDYYFHIKSIGDGDVNYSDSDFGTSAKKAFKIYTYTFTSKAWADSNSGWTSDKDGYQYNGNTSPTNVQVTKTASGAGATSKSSFSNITSISVNAKTTSSGVGNITVKVGTGEAETICSLSKNTTSTDYSLNYNPSVSGKVTFVVNCTTNSMYLTSITVVADK